MAGICAKYVLPPSEVMATVLVTFSKVYSRTTEPTPTRSVTSTLISICFPTSASSTGSLMEMTGGSRSMVTFLVLSTAGLRSSLTSNRTEYTPSC
ncbi:MAG: hypothetical protein A4E30_00118 [Methanomassiliicoccales archaeon PtaB.Bin215]|nr:MAG: hypothetical protein A4E30_00118 [Methanomassiliicoccales archaeon PtaB.Bin215]